MRLIGSSILFLIFTTFCTAQDDIVQLKNVSDTILNTKRQLKVADPLDAVKTMQKLFPGKVYTLSDYNTFISWNCKNCKTALYTDVNGVEGDQNFPYERGVATRILDNIDYSDSKGNQFKLLLFNHSGYDEDGLQTGRFSGGLIGLAKFTKNANVWEMRSFQPAIAAFGAFSQAPKPKLVEIGQDQYAFTLVHSNGGAGGAYSGYLYLIVGFDGKYQPLMEVPNFTLSNSSSSEWSSSYKVVTDNNKKFFRDFVITTTGSYRKAKGTEDDYEVDMPVEVSAMAKTKKQFNFVIEKRLSFNGKWYNITGKPVVKFSNIK
ncbi:glycoside hydrolase family 68 protein [Flavobacterium geliluteum]|uniref:Glycoside hydrolase family 68 protein n=1 Tax=Flavobacterium geliluteum TaxID=2816120 RepID=A0A941B3Y5_9FLAO|nr:glycoside hydrolase family 68 protein [Flavobacterium geliluteum]MBP4139003.1 glycoside hydrolase family 68 protein [Flavobacterium geliluteum]